MNSSILVPSSGKTAPRCCFSYVALMALMALIASTWIAGCAPPTDTGGGELSSEAPVPVRVARATQTSLTPTLDLLGMLVPIPERTVTLSIQIPGLIRDVLVHEGQSVEADDVIVRLDDRIVASDLAVAEANVKRAKAQLLALEHGARIEEIQAARNRVEEAKSRTVALRKKHAALQPLWEHKEISPVKYAQSEAALKAAEADAHALTAQLRLLEAGTRPERLAEARAEVDTLEAEAKKRQLTVELCVVRTPIAGVITKFPARHGMFVSPPDLIAEILDSSTLFAQIRVPRDAISKIHPGNAAQLHTPTYPNQVFEGTLSRIGQEADPASGEVTAFVAIENKGGLLKPGFTCRVHLSLPPVENAISVPIQAVSMRNDHPVVTVIRDNKAYETDVQLGIQTDTRIQIRQGLDDNDIVAIERGYGLPDGCPVQVLP